MVQQIEPLVKARETRNGITYRLVAVSDGAPGETPADVLTATLNLDEALGAAVADGSLVEVRDHAGFVNLVPATKV